MWEAGDKVIDKDPTWRAGAVFTRGELEQFLSDERLPPDRRMVYALPGLGGPALRGGRRAPVAPLRRDAGAAGSAADRLVVAHAQAAAEGDQDRAAEAGVGAAVAAAKPRETRKVLDKLEATGLDRVATTLALATVPKGSARVVLRLAGT